MKLILASAGFATEEIVKKTEELVGKSRHSINIAIINECYAVEHKNNLRWVLNDLNNVKDNFGGNLELVNLLALDLETIRKRIEINDVIFVVGGNTDYLMKVFNESGFSEILPELLKTKVYVGSSAGGMILGKRLSSEAYMKIYGERKTHGIEKFLELVDLTEMPHLDSPLFPNRKEQLLEAAKNHPGLIYGIRDNGAIVVNGEKISTIGSDPLVLNN